MSANAPSTPAAAPAITGDVDPSDAGLPEPTVTAPPTPIAPPAQRAAPAAKPCWRTIITGYALLVLGSAVIPFVPKLKSPAGAHFVLILCMIALCIGAAAVIWGFVRHTLQRRV